MKERRKSMSDIYRQACRIGRQAYADREHPGRWKKIKMIEEIYLTNIVQHFGFSAYQEFCSYSCGSMGDPEEKAKADEIYLSKIGKDVYHHPFDWDKVRNVSSIKEAVSISWSLHWMGYSVQPESWTFEEIKADLIALADAYGCTS